MVLPVLRMVLPEVCALPAVACTQSLENQSAAKIRRFRRQEGLGSRLKALEVGIAGRGIRTTGGCQRRGRAGVRAWR
jgi:hypothetical protein